MGKKDNPNLKKNDQDNKNKTKTEFEFCKVCKLNHDQGRRHNYFPNHTKSLSSFLSRFLKKISDVRFFLKNPILLRPEHASHNRLWCVFCDADIEELGSLFVCNNAIRHLSSSEHLKNLKNFLWKYGGGMDRVDSFRVSDSDILKWENRCKTLKSATPSLSGKACGPLQGDSNDIHDNIYSDNLDNLEKNTFHSFELSISNGVFPLQNFTNEKIQVSYPKVSEGANICPRLPETTSLSVSTHNNMDPQGMYVKDSIPKDLTGYSGNQHTLNVSCRKSSVAWSPSFGGVGRLGNGESADQEAKANVHSGATPPWLERTEENQLNGRCSTEHHMNGIGSSSRKSGKAQKLNPNRVGAAWAERRKIELEMEKIGETVTNSCDANWLPNFGRVWQSGSRKESRKEFEMENEKSLERSSSSDLPIKIQPYVSKRMRKESGDGKDDDGGHLN